MPKIATFSQKELCVILENILEYANAYKIQRFSIGFAGGGEPLLAWDILKQGVWAIHQKDTSKRLRFYIITNGILLDSHFLKTYKNLATFVNLVVSLDGDAKTHNTNRIYKHHKGTHENIMQNIGIYKSLFGKMPDINLCVSRLSLQRKQEILHFLLDNGFDNLTFTRLFHCKDTTQEISQKEFMDFVYFFSQYPFIIRNIEAIRQNKKDCIMYGNTCGVGFNNVFYFDKKVYPCMRFTGDSKNILGDYDSSLLSLEQSMQKLQRPCEACYYEEY